MKTLRALLLSSGHSSPGVSALALGLLRVALGALMFFGHGLPKLMSYSEKSATFSDPLGVGPALSLGLAVFAECFCALLVTLGLGTRLAVIPLIITMAVAVFIVHSGDPFARQEKALLFGIGFLVLLVGGGGSFSLGNLFRR